MKIKMGIGLKDSFNRRDFLKLSRIAWALAMGLNACAPPPPSKPDIVLNEQGLENLTKFNEDVGYLRAVFGKDCLEQTSDLMNNTIKGCDDIVNLGFTTKGVYPEDWGAKIDKVEDEAENHWKKVDIRLPEHLEVDREEIASRLSRPKDTFPALSLVCKHILVHDNSGGGHAVYQNANYDDLDGWSGNIQKQTITTPNPIAFEETSAVTQYHEYVHLFEKYFKDVMSFVSYESFTGYLTATGSGMRKIVEDFLSVPNYHELKYFTNFFTDSTNRQKAYDEALKNFDFISSFDSEWIIADGDTNEVIAQKKGKQMSFMIHTIGRRLLDVHNSGTSTSLNDSQQKAAEGLMKIFFEETNHYLVGPCQTNNGITDSYSPDPDVPLEIHNINKEVHRVRMEALSAPSLHNDPGNIRESLGLSRSITTVAVEPSTQLTIPHNEVTPIETQDSFGLIMDFGGDLIEEGIDIVDGRPYEMFRLPSTDSLHFYYYLSGPKSDNLYYDFIVKTNNEVTLDEVLNQSNMSTLGNPNPNFQHRYITSLITLFDPKLARVELNNSRLLTGQLVNNVLQLDPINPSLPQDLIFIDDGQGIRLYRNPIGSPPVNALVFESRGINDRGENSVWYNAIVTDGNKCALTREFLPEFEDLSKGLIIESFNIENHSIFISKIKDDQIVRFQVMLIEDDFNKIKQLLNVTPDKRVKTDLDFGIQEVKGKFFLDMKLNILSTEGDPIEYQTDKVIIHNGLVDQ